MPDAILFKTAKLTEEEYALIAQHPVIGSEILRDVDFLGEGKLVVRHHHERWDGTGYPDGLAGEEIPLAGAGVRGRRRARRADDRPPVPSRPRLGRTRARRSAASRAPSSIPPSSPPTTTIPDEVFARPAGGAL